MQISKHVGILLVLLNLQLIVLAGPKTDTVYFQNGDKLTCEFKNLQNNLMHVSTSDAGTLDIKWDKIDSIYIMQYLLIETKDGEHLIGTIFPTDSLNIVGVAGGYGIRYMHRMSIVRMYPYRKQFFKRMSGNIGSGFSYAQANKLSTFDFNGNMKYTAEKFIIKSRYDARWSSEEGRDNAERHEASINHYRLLPRRFFYTTLISLERNSELNLDLRTNLGVGLGNNFIFNNHSIAFGALGFQVNKEMTADSSTMNSEGIIALNYSLFKLSSPKIDLTISTNVFPNLTDFERVRASVDSKLRWELFNNFYIKYTVYYTFDSKPLSAEAKKEDWATTIGIEFSFN
jgi:hypothetical protein